MGVQYASVEGQEEGREPPYPAPSAEETLLRCRDLASSLRLLRAEHLSTGLELLRRIQERLLAILQHSTQVAAQPARPPWGYPEGKASRANGPGMHPSSQACPLATWHFLQNGVGYPRSRVFGQLLAPQNHLGSFFRRFFADVDLES